MRSFITTIFVLASALFAWGQADLVLPVLNHDVPLQQKTTDQTILQMPGFPIDLSVPSFIEAPWNMWGVVLADLDGSPGLEIIYSFQRSFPPKASEGFVMAWDSAAVALAGFPVTTVGGAFFAPSVGDLDGDGDQEIVQVTIDDGNLARVYAINHDGEVLDGFPVVAGRASIADGATLFDLDGDNELEIIYVSDLAAHVFENDGTEWTDGWPVPLGASALGTPAVGDVDNDGRPEIFLTEWSLMHLLDINGRELDGWPRGISGSSFSVLSSAALADLDHDSDLEIVVPALVYDAANGSTTNLHVFHHDASAMPGWPQHERIEATECPPLVTDLDDDGVLEILIGSMLEVLHEEPGRTWRTLHAQVFAWNAHGVSRLGFPWAAEQFTGEVTLVTAADIDGDGSMEIFTDAETADFDTGGYIFGLTSSGQEIAGFPLRPIGETWFKGAILGDVDLDGDLELGTASFSTFSDSLGLKINLYDLEGTARASERDWLTYHATNQRSGLYGESTLGKDPMGLLPSFTE